MSAHPALTLRPLPTRADRRAWLGLAVLFLPTLLVAVDNTVLSFALPAISEALAPSAPQLLWIVDVYPLALAGLLVTMGTLGDRIGRRRLLLIGVAGFGAVSAAAAFATDARSSSRPARCSGSSARCSCPRRWRCCARCSSTAPAPARPGHLGDRVRRGCGAGPGARRRAAGARLVGLGVPGQRAGDGGLAGARTPAAAGVPGRRRRQARPAGPGAVDADHGRVRAGREDVRQGRPARPGAAGRRAPWRAGRSSRGPAPGSGRVGSRCSTSNCSRRRCSAWPRWPTPPRCSPTPACCSC